MVDVNPPLKTKKNRVNQKPVFYNVQLKSVILTKTPPVVVIGNGSAQNLAWSSANNVISCGNPSQSI